MKATYWLVGLVAWSSTLAVSAYELETHALLSQVAIAQSISNRPDMLTQLGLKKSINDKSQLFPRVGGELRSIFDLIGDGARLEDDSYRGLYHFFNPITGTGIFGNASSPDWSLEDRGSYTFVPQQSYSFRDAREYLFQALTNPDNDSRKRQFGLLFQSIGQIVHHIQDMAQPQHVRDDPHLALSMRTQVVVCALLGSLICSGVRANINPSNYEAYIEKNRERFFPPALYAAVYSSDDTSTFASPRQFWSGSGKGIADYTNRGFVSDGTNFRGPPGIITTAPGFDSPSGAGASINPVKGAQLRLALDCPGAPLPLSIKDDDEVWFIGTNVRDLYTGVDTSNPKTSAYSIFDSDLEHRGKEKVFTLNRFNFCAAQAMLLPRAVGYSAGLINYFFRGSIEITVPDEGIYGIVDTSPSGCGSPCGFRKLKLKVKNVTPGNGTFREEPMGDDGSTGNLWAVVKYHLNSCYQPDLSGEDGGSHFAGNSCRSANEYVSVSAPHPVGLVSADKPQQLTFDFTDKPIPINASDVFLQVLFRGKLGLETDAVAVATKDITEPSYYRLENATDYYFDDLGDHQYHSISAGYTSKVVTNVRVAFGPQADKIPPVATLDLLSGGEHAQIAMLMDLGRQPASVSMSGDYLFPLQVSPFDPAEFTQDDAGPAAGIYRRNCELYLMRGLYMERGLMLAQGAHGVISWHTMGGVQPRLPTSDSATDTHRVHAESVRLEECEHGTGGTGGMYDTSTMAPFLPASAKPWSINF